MWDDGNAVDAVSVAVATDLAVTGNHLSARQSINCIDKFLFSSWEEGNGNVAISQGSVLGRTHDMR